MLPLRDRNPTRRVPVVTILLILVNVAVYFGVQPQGRQLVGRVEPSETLASDDHRFTLEHAAIPCEVTTGEPLSAAELPTGANAENCGREGQPVFPDKSVWLAILFSMFFHGGLLHIGGNMLFLWIFGNNVEDHLGYVRYLAFYLVSGVVATLAHVAVQPDSTIPLVGASGAVAGVMGAYLVWFPNVRILTVFILFFIMLRDISAKWLLGLWFVSQFFVNPNAGVAWVAHVGGFLFGAAVGALVRGNRRARELAWRSDARW